MSEYFDKLRSGLGDAAQRRAHRPWYVRLRLTTRTRVAAVLVAALVVATPAVGVAAGWFSKGAPDRYPPVTNTAGLGRVLPHGDRMLPIRVADPDGGPPWGLRLVRTSRDDTCLQLGRVEDGQLGSLGIDGAWSNDQQFHAIPPNDSIADYCGATDAAGHGFVSTVADGIEASANATLNEVACNPQSAVTRRSQIIHQLEASHPAKGSPRWTLLQRLLSGRTSLVPTCAQGGERLVMLGLLGPDATSVTYRAPSGRLVTERTVGGVGAYLIVLPYTSADCDEYGGATIGSFGGCGGGDAGGIGLSSNGPVTKVTYRNGSSCSVAPPAGLVAAYNALMAKFAKLPDGGTTAERQRLSTQFKAAEHVSVRNASNKIFRRCPTVGWVNSTTPRVTEAEVASPLTVRVTTKPTGACYGAVPGAPKIIACKVVHVSFIARQPVTTSHSGYQVQVITPDLGGEGQGDGQNVRVGERLHFTLTVPAQVPGVYHLTASFIANAGQDGRLRLDPLGRRSGKLVVGTYAFTVRR